MSRRLENARLSDVRRAVAEQVELGLGPGVTKVVIPIPSHGALLTVERGRLGKWTGRLAFPTQVRPPNIVTADTWRQCSDRLVDALVGV